MRDIIEGAGGTVEHSGPKDAWVLGDPRALRLVIDNLIDNSIKYATDVPRIIVRLSQSDHDIMIEITDDGIGMSRTAKKRLNAFGAAVNYVEGQAWAYRSPVPLFEVMAVRLS